jgi:tetratricopeptide (TPR) repeat protein
LETVRDFRGIALIHQLMGEVLLEWKGRTEAEAQRHFEDAIQIAESHMFSATATASYKHLGEIAKNSGDMENAKKYFSKAYALAKQEGDNKVASAARMRIKEVGEMEVEREDVSTVVSVPSTVSSRYFDYEEDISSDLNLASMIDKVK